jgi:flagellar protein FlbD
MVRVTKINGDSVFISAELIETIEQNPDTVITLTTRNRVMVKESADEVVERVIHWYRSLRAAPLDG